MFPPDVIRLAQVSQFNWNVPAAITLAQWSVESDFGRAMPPGSNNPFGITAVAGEPSVLVPTREVINDRSVIVIRPFRKFGSIAEAFEEHGRLLSTKYPDAMTKANDPDAFAAALAKYATDPNYAVHCNAG